ncbi:hypothetical protein SD81_017175 [Tolypothrix campylonemoides VB511288]|nr:hypothetical protein SD81_017175 [Tolypothrix campylonemoides VB511288]
MQRIHPTAKSRWAFCSRYCKAGAGEVKIITDDINYAVVPNIQVFTSNREAIQAATFRSLP